MSVAQIPFSGNWHKTIVTIGSIASGIGAFLVSSDTVPFGWDAYDIGLSLIWLGTIANIVSTAIRANVVPGVTSGTGVQ